MTSKLHTKPIFNNVISHLKNIIKQRLLAVLCALFTCIASTTTAQAELIDLSDAESVIQLSTQDANWLKQPSFRLSERSLRCLDSETGEPVKVSSGQILAVSLKLLVNESGNITKVEIVESSGNRCLDSSAAHQVRTGLMKPFVIKGKKVAGQVTLPIKFVVP